MQCASYLSGDQIIAASGCFWPQFDSVGFCRNSRDYNILVHPPSINQGLSYNKDLLREIILKHEAIFKYQVYELHRLYGRQRELMNEIQMKKLSTNCFLSGMQCDQWALQQTPCRLLSNPRDNEPLAQGVESLQKPSTFVPWNSIQTGSDLYVAERDFKELKASSSGRNKFGKRLLDLELPAELFMDIDEGEQFEDKNEIHPVLHDPSIDISNSSQKSNAVSEGTSSNLNLSCGRMSCNFDLNEPVQLDEPINFISSMYSNMSSTEIMHLDQDLSGNSRSKSPVPNEVVHRSLKEKGSAGSSFTSGLEVSFSYKLPHSSDNSGGLGSEVAGNCQDFNDSNNQRLLSSSITNSSSPVLLSNDTNAVGSFNKPREVPIVVQALPCFHTPGLNRTSRASTGSAGIKVKQEYLCPNLNAACSPSLGCVTSHVSCNTKNQSTDEYCFARHLKDSDCTKSVVDVNLNVVSSSTSPEKEASHEKVEFTDGVVNLDLNVLPSSALSETKVSQEKVESTGNNCGLENSVGQLNEIGDKPDYDIKIVVSPKLLEPPSSSSQFSSLTSITLLSSSSENEDIQNHEKSKFTARVVPSSSSQESETCSKDDTYLSTEVRKEISMSETGIDLPSTFGEEKLSLVPTVADVVGTGFEAPDSSDNQEHSPPREESDGNQREQLEDSKEDLNRIAAEAIVSISLSGEQQCLKTGINRPYDASTDCLNWFSGIVSSVADHVENEFEDLLSDAPGGDCNQLAFNALKNFEAMTFKSTGTKVEDTFHKTVDQKIKITGDIVLPSLRQRGRRARNAGVRKEIQSDVAAGSLSPDSCDLTEDIQHIKNLTVATRTVKARRKVGKTGHTKGKRQTKKAFPSVVGRRRVCSLPKQQHSYESEQCFVQSCLFGWGKKSARQKHKRVQNW